MEASQNDSSDTLAGLRGIALGIQPREKLCTESQSSGRYVLPLRFVDQQNLLSHDPKIRSAIRSHVMRDTYLKRQRLKARNKRSLGGPRLAPKKKQLDALAEPDLNSKGGARIGETSQRNDQQLFAHVARTQLGVYLGVLGAQCNDEGDRNIPQCLTELADETEEINFNAVFDTKNLSKHLINVGKSRCCPNIAIERSLRGQEAGPCSKERRGVKEESKSGDWALTLTQPKEQEQGLIHDLAKAAGTNDGDKRFDLHGMPSVPSILKAKINLLGGSWREDPFNIYSSLAGCQNSFFLSYYIEIMQSLWKPEQSKIILELYLSHEIFICSCLFLAALHFRAYSKKQDVFKDILFLRSAAIRAINNGLDDPVLRISDIIIGGLAYLIMAEERFGSQDISAVHRKGLRQILQARQKTQGHRIDKLLDKLVRYSEFQEAESIDSTARNENAMGPVFQTPVLTTTTEEMMFEVLPRLKSSETFLKIHGPNHPNRKQELYFGRRLIEWHLKTDQGGAKNQSWLLASLIYLDTILAVGPQVLLLPETQKGRITQLKSALEWLIESTEGFMYSYRMVIWVLLFGGLHARGDEEVWLRSALQTACDTIQLPDWSSLKAALKDLTWVESKNEAKLRASVDFEMGTFVLSE